MPRACGAVGCARGARPCIPAVSAVCLPASGRARSACRAVCAVRALRRASPPSSGGQVRALKGFPILQREHRGTGTRLPALRSPPIGGDLAVAMQKSPRSAKSGGTSRNPKRPSMAENGLSKVIAPPIDAVWVALAARSDVVHVVPPAIRANVFKLARAPHATKIKFAIRRALVGQDHQANLVKARKVGRDGCPFVRRPCLRYRRCSLRFRHAPTPLCAEPPTHPSIHRRRVQGKRFLSFFDQIKNRWPQSSTRRRSSAQQRAPSPAPGAP